MASSGGASSPDWGEWPLCGVNEIGDPGAYGFLLGDGDWPFRGFVVRRNGRWFAYANICPHARHPLDMLPDEFLVQDGSMIRCMSHGAQFVPETGECVFGPCVGTRLLSLEVRQDSDGQIFVRAPESLRDEFLSAWSGW